LAITGAILLPGWEGLSVNGYMDEKMFGSLFLTLYTCIFYWTQINQKLFYSPDIYKDVFPMELL
jgi:hypothetical protein